MASPSTHSIISARASCTRNFCVCSVEKSYVRNLFTLVSNLWEFLKQCLIIIITKTCFDSFSLFLLVWRVCKTCERQVSPRVRVAHLHYRLPLSSPSRCFQLSKNLDKLNWNWKTLLFKHVALMSWEKDKDLFRYILCWICYNNFHQREKVTNIICASFT